MLEQLGEIVKKIQYKHRLSIEQVAASIGYSRVYLTKEMKKGSNENIVKLLSEKYPEILQSVINEDGVAYKTNASKIQQEIIELRAMNRTILQILSEMRADQLGKSPHGIMNDYETLVNSNVEAMKKEFERG